jgi:hypothetical protein
MEHIITIQHMIISRHGDIITIQHMIISRHGDIITIQHMIISRHGDIITIQHMIISRHGTHNYNSAHDNKQAWRHNYMSGIHTAKFLLCHYLFTLMGGGVWVGGDIIT